jgi:hypothetical protein
MAHTPCNTASTERWCCGTTALLSTQDTRPGTSRYLVEPQDRNPSVLATANVSHRNDDVRRT